MSKILLNIDNLQVSFKTQRGELQAVRGVSLSIREGEIFGVVGESGCGKSVTSLSVLRLLPGSGKITGGSIYFQGQDLTKLSKKEMQHIRGESISTIFQDPMSSLNPVFKIGTQLTDVLRQHREISKEDARRQVLMVLQNVGLPDAERIFNAYPHQLSGGMQQRVMIAMALVCQPSLLIADEPTTALDVTIQSQILHILQELRETMGIAIMLITHNFGVIAQICDRVAVLYAGEVVEISTTKELFDNPQHPYTQGLIAAIPKRGQKGTQLTAIPGTVPGNPARLKGCTFAPRCSHAFDLCTTKSPTLHPVAGQVSHLSSCHLIEREGVVS